VVPPAALSARKTRGNKHVHHIHTHENSSLAGGGNGVALHHLPHSKGLIHRAALRAGFFGLVGGFLGNASNGSLDKAVFDLAGPVAGEFEKVVYSPLYDLLAKEDNRSDAGKHLTDALRHFMPGQSLWYGRLTFERLFLDNLEEMIDGPDANKRWHEAEKKMRKEQHRGFWWKRRKVVPR
jgi:hypothetical protein